MRDFWLCPFHCGQGISEALETDHLEKNPFTSPYYILHNMLTRLKELLPTMRQCETNRFDIWKLELKQQFQNGMVTT
jgi:hypothetical protein